MTCAERAQWRQKCHTISGIFDNRPKRSASSEAPRDTFTYSECGRTVLSKIGLISHLRAHARRWNSDQWRWWDPQRMRPDDDPVINSNFSLITIFWKGCIYRHGMKKWSRTENWIFERYIKTLNRKIEAALKIEWMNGIKIERTNY